MMYHYVEITVPHVLVFICISKYISPHPVPGSAVESAWPRTLLTTVVEALDSSWQTVRYLPYLSATLHRGIIYSLFARYVIKTFWLQCCRCTYTCIYQVMTHIRYKQILSWIYVISTRPSGNNMIVVPNKLELIAFLRSIVQAVFDSSRSHGSREQRR